MNTQILFLLTILTTYFIGAIPFGFLIGKCRGKDIRQLGSKNIGATNVYRTVGKTWGILAFLCDFLKGLLPTLAAQALAAGRPDLQYLPLVAGVTAVAGHMWTCFMRFKGGKGVATGFGMLVALVPWLVLVAFGLFVVSVWLSHYISVGSILAAAFLLVTVWFPILGTPGTANIPQCVLVACVAAFVIWKHRANIRRLIDGCENKIY